MTGLEGGVVAAYLAASLALGAAVRGRASSLEGYLVAGRSVRGWVLAFTFGATYFSSVVMIVGSSWAYAWGPRALVIPLANIAVGALLAFIVVGERASSLSARLGALTAPELVASLHGSRGLQRIMGAVTALGLTLYLVVVTAGAAVVAAEALGLSRPLAAALVGGVMAFYVGLSGMYGVVMTDVLQGVIMASVIGVVSLASLARVGPSSLDSVKPLADPGLPAIVDLALLTSLATWGLPQMLNRFYTVPGRAVVRRAAGVATLFAFIVALGSFLAGLEAHRLAAPPRPLEALPALVEAVLGRPGLAVLAAAVLAASMSTADSVALTAATSIVYDAAGGRSLGGLRLASVALTLAAATAAAAVLALPAAAYKPLTAIFKAGWTIAAGSMLVPVTAALAGDSCPPAALASALAGSTAALAMAALKASGIDAPSEIPLLGMSFTLTILASLAAYAAVRAAAGWRCGRGRPAGIP